LEADGEDTFVGGGFPWWTGGDEGPPGRISCTNSMAMAEMVGKETMAEGQMPHAFIKNIRREEEQDEREKKMLVSLQQMDFSLIYFHFTFGHTVNTHTLGPDPAVD